MDKDSAYWLSCNAQHSLTFVIYLLKHRNPGIALPLLFRLGGILSRRPSPADDHGGSAGAWNDAMAPGLRTAGGPGTFREVLTKVLWSRRRAGSGPRPALARLHKAGAPPAGACRPR